MLAPDHVAQSAEHNGAEGAYGEACGEREQREDEGRCLIDAGEKMLRYDRGEGAVKVEVVPLEHGAQGRGENDLALLLGDPAIGRAAYGCIVDYGYESSPSCSCCRPEYLTLFLPHPGPRAMSSDYGLRKACKQADGLASLQGFLKNNRLRADIHSATPLKPGPTRCRMIIQIPSEASGWRPADAFLRDGHRLELRSERISYTLSPSHSKRPPP